MLRRSSASGFLALVVSIGILFVPFAWASGRDRAAQTLTLLVLFCAIVLTGIVWRLLMTQRPFVSAGYVGLAALAGAFSSIVFVQSIPELAAASRDDLLSRLLFLAVADGVGVWLYVIGLRRAFPRRVRGMAGAAIVLLSVGFFPGPLLLFQPSVGALGIRDIDAQLSAAYLYWTVGTTLMIAPFLAMATLPGDWFERWWGVASRDVMAISNRAFAVGVAVVTLALALFFAIYSFDRRPTTADEIAQLWHAQMLLHGRLAMPPDPNPEFFAIDNIIDRPLWMSQFPIGGPAVLAIGLVFHAVWLLNPILTALIALNVYRFAQRAYGEPQARVAAALIAVSPMMLLMGGTHMNHTPTAWLATLALAALPVWVGTSSPRERHQSAASIGGSIGIAIMIRPLDGVLVGAVMGVLMLVLAARERARLPSVLVAIAAGAGPVLLLLLANWSTTGSPFRFGYEVLWGSNHSLGLHDDPTGNPHTAWRALLLGVKYASQLNWILTAWPVPVLLILAIGVMLARRPTRWDVLLLSLFGAQLFVYALYWHDGQFAGPRFLFTVAPAALVLVARAPFFATEYFRSGTRWRVAVMVVPVCIGVTWLRSMRPFGVQSLAREFHDSRSRLKVDPPREAENGVLQNALIFVQEGAGARTLHRLWGLGVSRPDAARLFAKADACSLVDAVRVEERRPATDSAGRLRRIEQAVRVFLPSAANPRVPDQNFRVSDSTSISKACAEEIEHDRRVRNTVAYGPMLLLNRFEHGRVDGPAIYVMDLGDRNAVLRARFHDRHWYRYELPRDRADSTPILVPYDSAQ